LEFFVFLYFEVLFKGINERNETPNSEENFNIYTRGHTHTHTHTKFVNITEYTKDPNERA